MKDGRRLDAWLEETKWELYEEITLTEAVTNIERNLDSEVKGVMVSAQIPQASANGDVYFRCIKGYTNVTVGTMGLRANNERYIRMRVYLQNGVWNADCSNASVGSYSEQTGMVSPNNIITEEQMSGIETFRFYCFGDGFPDGTVIKFEVLKESKKNA